MKILQASGIKFAYDVEPVLVGMDVSMDAGQTVVVIGPNGSGKSTLLRVLLGDLRGPPVGVVRPDVP